MWLFKKKKQPANDEPLFDFERNCGSNSSASTNKYRNLGSNSSGPASSNSALRKASSSSKAKVVIGNNISSKKHEDPMNIFEPRVVDDIVSN